ncbi:MAG: hypothetical protein R6W69_05840 [Anaerolineales bacterium]
MNKYVGKYVLGVVMLLATVGCITVELSAPQPKEQTSSSVSVITEQHINLLDASAWNWQQIASPEINSSALKNSIAVLDSRGYLHLFWDLPFNSSGAFIYHSYYDGNAWTQASPIAQTLGSSELRSDSLVRYGDTIHLLWYNKLKLGGPYRLMYASFDGTNWSPESEVMRIEKDPNLWGKLSVTEKGIHAIVKSPNIISADLSYLTFSGTDWGSIQTVTPPMVGLFNWNYYPNANGGIGFYGQDATNKKLVYAHWQDGQTTTKYTEIVLNRNDNTFLDSSGNYHTYWTGQVSVPGGAIEGLTSQCVDSNLTAWPEQILSGQSKVTTKPIFAQSTNKTALLWVDGSEKIQLLFAKNCSEADLFTLPLPVLEDKKRQPLAFAISDIPSKVCVVSKTGFSEDAEIYCADMP